MIAADNIARDTYTGRHVRRGIPAGYQIDQYTARELAQMFPNQIFAIWEHSGHANNGRVLLHRARYIAQPGGALFGYDADGRHITTHPDDRILRILCASKSGLQ